MLVAAALEQGETKQLVPVQLVTRHLECVQEAQPAPVQVGGRGVALELYVVHQVVVSKVQYAGGGLVVGVAVPLVGVGLVWDGAQVDDLVCEGGGSPLLHALDPRVQACVGRTQDGFTKKVPVYLCEGERGGREGGDRREEREREGGKRREEREREGGKRREERERKGGDGKRGRRGREREREGGEGERGRRCPPCCGGYGPSSE